MADADRDGVQLEDGSSATAHLHEALLAGRAAAPHVFADVNLPEDADVFKSSYAEVLPRFEAARAESAERTVIAHAVVDHARAAMVVNPRARPLAAATADAAEPPTTTSHASAAASRLQPAVPFDGVAQSGEALSAAVRALVERGSASPAVATAVDAVIAAAGDDGIDLTGRRIVMLGGGAELAPTRLWLDGGADVLWIDLADPPADLLSADWSGTLHWVPGGLDLLGEPHRVRATIERFAGDRPVDMGLYAYAPGRAREWRLTAAMNAVVDALPAGTVSSVAMLLSPTTCGVLSADDVEIEERRRAGRARWQSGLSAIRLLGSGNGHVRRGATAVNRGVVSIQGGSYQAAQYVEKMLAAEVWAAAPDGFAVSANTAGISLTESLHHPVFDMAFAGAESLGVETFDPPTTAALNGLLTLHDRLDPTAGDRGLDELLTTRVHGGIYVTPYPIDQALRVAAALGAVRKPSRLLGLVKR